MEKNVAGKWIVFAYGLPDHASPGVPLTGDAANITANIRIDGAAANAVDDTNPTELEDGFYIFDITAAEANGENLLLTPQSATADVQVISVPGAVWTRPANFSELGIETDGDVTQVNTTVTNTDMVAAAPTAAAVVDEWESQSQADPTGFHVNVIEVSGVAEDIATATGVSAVETDTQDIQSRVPAALVGGLMSSDITAISTDTTAADNLELQYDTTGLTGDTFPATQAGVGNLAVGSAAISLAMGQPTNIQTLVGPWSFTTSLM